MTPKRPISIRLSKRIIRTLVKGGHVLVVADSVTEALTIRSEVLRDIEHAYSSLAGFSRPYRDAITAQNGASAWFLSARSPEAGKGLTPALVIVTRQAQPLPDEWLVNLGAYEAPGAKVVQA